MVKLAIPFSRSLIRIDIKSNKEYNYYYENGRLMRATECQIEDNTDGIVVKKEVLSTIFYAYDSEDRVSRKRIMFADGKEHVVYYETPDDSNTVAKFVIDEQTVTSHSKTDSFGRKVFDELQIGKGFVSRQFVISYLAPTIIAAVQMLYYATQKKKGCTYRINLFGGSSIKFN